MSGGSRRPAAAFQWDLARQAERLDWLKAQLPLYASWGYTELYLHLEDAVEYPSLPGVARRGAYSYRELAQLVWEATRHGIGVVPIVNLLGHTQYLIQVPELRELNECVAPDGSPLPAGQICPVHPRTLKVAEALIRDLAPFCTAGKVHVGLDESYLLGRHPKSRAEIARIGVAGHFARYVGKLEALCRGLGLRMGIWADMLALLPEAIPLIPQGIAAYDWHYYPFRRNPAIELRNFSPYDLAGPLRARGIGYWGCAMNGAFRHEPVPIVNERLRNIVSWWRRLRRADGEGLLVTSWESSRLAAEVPLLVDAAAAGLWLDGEEDPGRLLAGGIARLRRSPGRGAAQSAWRRTRRALAVADAHPYSGYFRWRVNDRWDTVASDEPLAAWRRERDALRKAASARLWAPLDATLRFRGYLAERDLFVREAAARIWSARAARRGGARVRAARLLNALDRDIDRFGSQLAPARSAARAAWRRTRPARETGPNERMVRADAERLRRLRAWLRRCESHEHALFDPSPVCGAWQLTFTVVNFAPAAQKVVVEHLSSRQGAEGGWEEVCGLFLIEFRARAARPRARGLASVFSAPIDWDGRAPFPRLRVCARGFGRFGVRDVVLTDGVSRFSPLHARSLKVLGRSAARTGWPNFDWSENRDARELRFRL